MMRNGRREVGSPELKRCHTDCDKALQIGRLEHRVQSYPCCIQLNQKAVFWPAKSESKNRTRARIRDTCQGKRRN